MQMAHPRVPEQISKVVLKALAKNPAERYASGQQFFAALEEAAKSQPVARANTQDQCLRIKAARAQRQPGNQSHAGTNASQQFQGYAGTEREPEI